MIHGSRQIRRLHEKRKSVGEGGTYAQILAALMYLFGLWSDISYTALQTRYDAWVEYMQTLDVHYVNSRADDYFVDGAI